MWFYPEGNKVPHSCKFEREGTLWIDYIYIGGATDNLPARLC